MIHTNTQRGPVESDSDKQVGKAKKEAKTTQATPKAEETPIADKEVFVNTQADQVEKDGIENSERAREFIKKSMPSAKDNPDLAKNVALEQQAEAMDKVTTSKYQHGDVLKIRQEGYGVNEVREILDHIVARNPVLQGRWWFDEDDGQFGSYYWAKTTEAKEKRGRGANSKWFDVIVEIKDSSPGGQPDNYVIIACARWFGFDPTQYLGKGSKWKGL